MDDYIFIDDSGSKRWETPYNHQFTSHPPKRSDINRDFWLKNYFVLAGLFVDAETIVRLNPIINNKKKTVFGTKHAEIHSSELRNPHQRRKRYTEKFGVTDETLADFIENFWYPLIAENSQIKIQAVVLDKRYFKNQRSRSPLAITVQALFDLEQGPNRASQIVFDQMDSEVKSAKGDQGTILQIANHEIDLGGFFSKYSHASIGFEKSSASHFLQLADTVAYNVFRQFVDYGDKWGNVKQNGVMYPYFERIFDNIYQRGNKGDATGVGIIKLPNPSGFSRK